MKLYVGNLSFQTSNEELERLFSQSGTVESAQVITTLAGNSRGFGFVEMASRKEGAAAIAEFHGKKVNGRYLTVNESKSPLTRAAGASFSSNQARELESYSNNRATRW
jgi:cold-inducible RNA-binding protein